MFITFNCGLDSSTGESDSQRIIAFDRHIRYNRKIIERPTVIALFLSLRGIYKEKNILIFTCLILLVKK